MQEKERLIIEKSLVVIGWNKTNERVSLVYNLQTVHKFFLVAEGWVRNFGESGFKNR